MLAPESIQFEKVTEPHIILFYPEYKQNEIIPDDKLYLYYSYYNYIQITNPFLSPHFNIRHIMFRYFESIIMQNFNKPEYDREYHQLAYLLKDKSFYLLCYARVKCNDVNYYLYYIIHSTVYIISSDYRRKKVYDSEEYDDYHVYYNSLKKELKETVSVDDFAWLDKDETISDHLL